MRLAALALASALCVLSSYSAVAHAYSRDEEPMWSWSEGRAEDLRIQLVTFGEGDSVHQYFGHNAMVVNDTRRRIAAMYNFGMFSFGPDMLPKYLRGRLEFWAAMTPVESTYSRYIAANRSVRVLELDLEPERRMRLAERLAFYVRPENSTYRYDHYRDNCSTKLRDLIDQALDGQLVKGASGPARQTYRGHTWRYTEHDPVIHMLLLLWMNDSMERPIRAYDQAFLPDELDRLVEAANYVDASGAKRKLVKSAYTLFEARREAIPETPSPLWPRTLLVGLALGALGAALGAWLSRRGATLPRILLGAYHTLLGLVLGVPGLVAGLFLFTEWEVTHWNENLYVANPLSVLGLFLGPAMVLGSRRAQRWLAFASIALAASSVLALALKLLPNFDQDNWLPLALLVPVNLGFGVAHLLVLRARTRSAPAQTPTAVTA